MVPITSELAEILQTAQRTPRSRAFIQRPVLIDPILGTYDVTKLGSQLVLDDILSCRVTSILEPGSNSAEVVFNNPAGNSSPINPASSLGAYYYPGIADQRVEIWSGILDSAGDEVAIPEGVFISHAFNQESIDGVNKATISALDNWKMFGQTVYAQFPPRLFGNQTSSFFNPAYQLTNPSGDLQTYICDAVNWMTDTVQAPFFASDFTPVAVYVGTVSSPASAPTTLTYSTNFVLGTVTFSSPLSLGSIVSVDARPLSMQPEIAMQHLFCDYGSFSAGFLKFDNSGIMMPVIDATSGGNILDIAKQIASYTAPRGTPWQIFFDALGYLNFRELAIDGPSVITLTDEKDLLKVPVEYQSQNIHNVVRATGTLINQQPITVISYSVDSINVFTQQPDFDIPSQYTATLAGTDPMSAVAILSGLTSSELFANDSPTLVLEIEILYNPTLEVGDVVTLRENKTGINNNFYISQITKEFDGGNITMMLRLTQVKRTQDSNFGLSAVAGIPIPSTPNTGIGQTSLLASVSIAGTSVVSNGQPVVNGYFQPVLANWTGGSLPIVISTVAPPPGSSLYIWRWITIEENAYNVTGSSSLLATGNGNSFDGGDIYPGNSSTPSSATVLDLTGVQNGLYGKSTQFADFRYDFDTAESRRYFHPLLRTASWISSDGITAYTTSQTFSDTWTGGVGASSPVSLYGNLRIGITDFYGTTTSGFVGQKLFDVGTLAATNLGANSQVKYGVDFGYPVTGRTIAYGINKKQTPCTLHILLATTGGLFQFKKIPFNLSI